MHAKFAKKMAQTETLRLKRQIFPCASALNFRETYDWADLHSGIFTYCPVHKCWPKTSWAGNQGNHQNFDPSLLPKNLWLLFMGLSKKNKIQKKSKMADSKKLRFSKLSILNIIFAKLCGIGPWVSRINWWEGYQCDSSDMVSQAVRHKA